MKCLHERCAITRKCSPALSFRKSKNGRQLPTPRSGTGPPLLNRELSDSFFFEAKTVNRTVEGGNRTLQIHHGDVVIGGRRRQRSLTTSCVRIFWAVKRSYVMIVQRNFATCSILQAA